MSLNKKTNKLTVNDYRTFCCDAKPLHPGRARWICPKCSKDVSMEFVFWCEGVLGE